MSCLNKFVFAAAIVATTLLAARQAHAVENCKVKIDRRGGTLLVSAKDVGEDPRWGFFPGEETNAFFNEADCFRNGKLRKCVLGGPDTTERITPPDLCTLYVADDSSTDCAAYIKGCVPGVRTAEPGPAGPPGAEGPVGPPGPPGMSGPSIVLVDGNDSIVGPFNQNTDAVYLSTPLGAVLVSIHTTFGFDEGLRLYYETADCSGPGLVRAQPLGSLVREAEGFLAGIVYYHPSSGSVSETNSTSLRPRTPEQCTTGEVFVAPDTCCCTNCPNSGTYAAPITLDLSGFEPPFKLQVR